VMVVLVVVTHKIWDFPRCFTWHCAQPEHTARTNGIPAEGLLRDKIK
jgi:hypothetical protein